jgi:hypothetical protein
MSRLSYPCRVVVTYECTKTIHNLSLLAGQPIRSCGVCGPTLVPSRTLQGALTGPEIAKAVSLLRNVTTRSL